MSVRLVWRSQTRFLRSHPWQTLLTVIGVALGVAMVVAVDLANESARRAMSLSIDSVSGAATHRIEGGSAGVDEQLYVSLRVAEGLRNSAPSVSDYIRIEGRTYTLLGVDPLAELGFGRQGWPQVESADQGAGWLLDTTGVVLSQTTADRLGLAVGDGLEMAFSGTTHRVRLAGVVADSAAEGLVLADLALAQVVLDRIGRLDHVDLKLTDEQAERLARQLPEDLRLASREEREHGLHQMTEGFHHNLTAMSLLALLIGGLLVYNTMTFSLLRRRQVVGIQRALGVTGGELMALILREALLLGAVGTLLGLLLGLLLAQGLVGLVLRTVNDLFFVLTVSENTVSVWALLRGALLGIGVTLVAVLPPAIEVLRTPPVAALRRSRIEHRARHLAGWLALVGLIGVVAGALLASQESTSLIRGFVALGLLVCGFCLAVPWLVRSTLRLALAGLPRRVGVTARLTLRGIEGGLSRTGLAIAALSVAVAATVSVVVMVTSFRASVDLWLQQTLVGDVYLTVPGRVPERPGPGLSEDLEAAVSALPGVAGVTRSRVVRVDTGLGRYRLLAVEMDSDPQQIERRVDELGWRQRVPDAVPRFLAGEGILVSEPLAHHHGLAPGDRLTLQTPSGNESLPILAIFTDYTSTQGLITMALPRYQALWGDREVSGLAVEWAPQADHGRLLEQIRALADREPAAVMVQASAELRALSMEIFDRTFAVTHVLRLLTVVVAFAGIFAALMLLQLERLRELAVLRATGMTGGGVARLTLLQSGCMGLLAGLLALPLGVVMSAVLVHVINLRAFGWSMDWILPWPVFAEALLLALLAALLAGCYPAWRAARVQPAQALREE